jgi:hypothetical protein
VVRRHRAEPEQEPVAKRLASLRQALITAAVSGQLDPAAVA